MYFYVTCTESQCNFIQNREINWKKKIASKKELNISKVKDLCDRLICQDEQSGNYLFLKMISLVCV